MLSQPQNFAKNIPTVFWDALLWPSVVMALAIGSTLLAQYLGSQGSVNQLRPRASVRPPEQVAVNTKVPANEDSSARLSADSSFDQPVGTAPGQAR